MNLNYILIGIIAYSMIMTLNVARAVILTHLIVKIMDENKTSKQREA